MPVGRSVRARRSGIRPHARFRSRVSGSRQRRATTSTGWKPNNFWALGEGRGRLNGPGISVKPVLLRSGLPLSCRISLADPRCVAHRPALHVTWCSTKATERAWWRAGNRPDHGPQISGFAPGAGARALAGGGLFKIVQRPPLEQAAKDLGRALVHFPTHLSTHQAGAGVADRPRSPLETSGSGRHVLIPWPLDQGRLPIRPATRSPIGNSSPWRLARPERWPGSCGAQRQLETPAGTTPPACRQPGSQGPGARRPAGRGPTDRRISGSPRPLAQGHRLGHGRRSCRPPSTLVTALACCPASPPGRGG